MSNTKTAFMAVLCIVLLALFIVAMVSFSVTFELLRGERRHISCFDDAVAFSFSQTHQHHRAPVIVAAYIIHMERRTDRNGNIKNLEHCLTGLVSLQVVAASDGSSLPDCLKMRRGEVGCFLSHAGIAERVAANAHFCASVDNWVLVFEDDVTTNLTQHAVTRQRMVQALQEMPETTSIVYFGFDEPPKRGLRRVGKHTYIGGAPWTTHAYAIRCVNAGSLADLYARHTCTLSIDKLLRRVVLNAGLVYADAQQRRVVPNEYGCGLFGQDVTSPSSIQPVHNPLMAAVQSLRDTLQVLASE